MVVRRIKPLSLATTGAVLSAVFGLINSIFAIINLVSSRQPLTPLSLLVLLFVSPLLYGIGGLVSSFIFAFIYNLVASKTGGVEIEE